MQKLRDNEMASAPSSTAAAGLTLAAGTAVGNALCDVGRKRLSKTKIGNAAQIAYVCLLEGLLGTVYLTLAGALVLPSAEFWLPALSSAFLNAVAKTLQTKAYSEYDISLCAPFNAALPVMQFLVSTYVLREPELPMRRVAGVFIVATGAVWLGKVGMQAKTAAAAHKDDDKHAKQSAVRVPPAALPLGPILVLINCVIWSFTTKLDELATNAAGKWVYLSIGKTMTGAMAAIGAWGARASASANGPKEGPKEGKPAPVAQPLWQRPHVLVLLLGVACAEDSTCSAITRLSRRCRTCTSSPSRRAAACSSQRSSARSFSARARRDA